MASAWCKLNKGLFWHRQEEIRRDIGSSRKPVFILIMFVFACKLMTLLALSGCVSAGMSTADSAPHVDRVPIKQITGVIVKYKDPSFDPTREAYLMELARDVGEIVYVRPMSGGAHVFRVNGAVNVEHFRRVVNNLAKRPEVDYAEPDRLMRPMR